jgi:hypothetical protein
VDCERAESHLRRLAEAELRRATTRSADRIPGRWSSARLALVAQTLSAVGAVDPDTADETEANLDLAVALRESIQGNQISPSQRRLSPDVRMRSARLIHSPSPRTATGAPHFRGLGTGQTRPVSQRAPSRVVPVGQVISMRNDDVRRELLLVAYVQSADGARFTMAGWPFRRFTAVDDRGVRYNIGFRGGCGEGVLVVRPDPPHDIAWLDLTTTPGEPAIRIDLDPPDSQFPVPDVTVNRKISSPGELLLNVVTARILTIAAVFPQDTCERLADAKPELLSHASSGLGDMVAALHAADVLSPASRLPGLLAGLCERLGVRDHGITAPPDDELPEPWQSMLTRCHRREPLAAPPSGSLAAMVADLPELDGAKITILGLHHGDRGTILHMLVGGVTPEEDWAYSRGVRPLPLLWIRDSSERWHTTRMSGCNLSRNTGDALLWLEIVPSLDSGIAWVEVIAAGQSAEARAVLRIGWEQAGQG